MALKTPLPGVIMTKAPADYANLQSKRFVLRRLSTQDIEPWSEFFADNPNLPFLAIFIKERDTEHVTRRDWSEKWMEKQFKRYTDNGFGLLAIVSKETGRLVGQAGISQKLIDGNIEHEIAYSILPSFWRQGIAHEVSEVLINYATEHQINRRVISLIHLDNIGSIRVAEKNGMTVHSKTNYLGMEVYVYGRYIS
jgi:RimJ/RimL family protein N-acetyltransferase